MSTTGAAVQPTKRRAPAAPAAPEADADETAKRARRDLAVAAQADEAAATAGDEAGHDDEADDSSSDVDSDEDAIDLSVPAKVKKEDLLQIEFEFYDPKEGDFHSVKQMLHQKLPAVCEGAALSDAADAIVGQPEVGLLVRVAGTEHVFGVVSALPAALHRKRDFWKAIEGHLLRVCPAAKAPEFKAALAAPGLGLLLSERILNIPDHLVPKIFENLQEDIAWATTKQPDVAARKAFVMDRLLLLAPLKRAAAASSSSSSSSSSSAGGGAKAKEERSFVKSEEAYLAKVADVSFELTLKPTEGGASAGTDGAAALDRPERFVAMVVNIAKAQEAMDDFDNDLPPLPQAQ